MIGDQRTLRLTNAPKRSVSKEPYLQQRINTQLLGTAEPRVASELRILTNVTLKSPQDFQTTNLKLVVVKPMNSMMMLWLLRDKFREVQREGQVGIKGKYTNVNVQIVIGKFSWIVGRAANCNPESPKRKFLRVLILCNSSQASTVQRSTANSESLNV
jgi:hypothetical protein